MKEYHKILHQLEKLKQVYPEYNMGRHLSTIIDGQEVWGMCDKELSGLVDKYVCSLSMHQDREIDKIINEGMCLDRYKLYEDTVPYEDE